MSGKKLALPSQRQSEQIALPVGTLPSPFLYAAVLLTVWRGNS